MEIIIVLALFFWLAQMEKAKKQKKAKAGQERDFVPVPPIKEQKPVQLDMLDELDDMTPEDMTPEPMDDLCEGARIETMEGKDPCHPVKPMEEPTLAIRLRWSSMRFSAWPNGRKCSIDCG